MLVLVFALAAMPVGTPVADGMWPFLRTESIGTSERLTRPLRPRANRILVYGTEIVSATALAGAAVFGGVHLGQAVTGSSDLERTAPWIIGSCVLAVPLTATTSAWGVGRAFGDATSWHRGFAGAILGELASIPFSWLCGRLAPSLGEDIGVFMLCAGAAAGAAIGCNHGGGE